MGKARLEAFSDGVIAIIITIMALELKVPQSAGLAALRPLIPIFFSYLLEVAYLLLKNGALTAEYEPHKTCLELSPAHGLNSASSHEMPFVPR